MSDFSAPLHLLTVTNAINVSLWTTCFLSIGRRRTRTESRVCTFETFWQSYRSPANSSGIHSDGPLGRSANIYCWHLFQFLSKIIFVLSLRWMFVTWSVCCVRRVWVWGLTHRRLCWTLKFCLLSCIDNINMWWWICCLNDGLKSEESKKGFEESCSERIGCVVRNNVLKRAQCWSEVFVVFHQEV